LWIVSAVDEVVLAFGGCEGLERIGDSIPEIIDGSGGGFSQERFQFGEGLLDGVEVRRIGREVDEPRADGLDGSLDGFDTVGGQIVEDYDIAGMKRRRE
jgi:hypothetical protein